MRKVFLLKQLVPVDRFSSFQKKFLFSRIALRLENRRNSTSGGMGFRYCWGVDKLADDLEKKSRSQILLFKIRSNDEATWNHDYMTFSVSCYRKYIFFRLWLLLPLERNSHYLPWNLIYRTCGSFFYLTKDCRSFPVNLVPIEKQRKGKRYA